MLWTEAVFFIFYMLLLLFGNGSFQSFRFQCFGVTNVDESSDVKVEG